MISNNFVELKGSVFKKFDKNNLFQVACSDVRERFHLFVLLSIVVLQTMKEYAWKEETLWVMVPDCLMVLISEIIVDWIKHAFITRFNELPVEVYRDYRLSLAYDMAQTRQKNAFTDHSDLVARRMGFIPLPLGVVMVRVLGNAVKIQGGTAITLAALGYCCLASFKILNNILLLGKACDLIYQHQQVNEKFNLKSITVLSTLVIIIKSCYREFHLCILKVNNV
uniref:Protein TAPT1 homolog n=1 Tax=Clastoptera arizonana TaxID=38151 RepID=A0A1B6D317_9HEMI